jgi:assimilatory nitrate reductase catalytic subunit
MAWLPQSEALARRERLRPLLAQFGYAACVPFGREPDTQGRLGLWLDVADTRAPDERALSGLRVALDLAADAMLDYRDPRTGMQRGLRVARDATGAERLQGFWICGTDAADNAVSQWWRETLQGDAALEMPARRMLAPGARERGGGAAAPASPQLCTCFNVSVAQAETALAAATGVAAQRIAQTQAQLRCGTNCGSCLPHLRRLAQERITLANPAEHADVILRAMTT